MAEIKDLIRTAYEALSEKKASDIKILDISKVSVIADYFMIASGSNRNQLQAMADEVEDKLAEQQCHPKNIEGYMNGSWILMDYSDFVIHLFDEENRLFYDLERIWRDGEVLPAEDL